MSRKQIVYKDFGGGDHGVVDGLKAPKNTFASHDVVVYSDGNIGPRVGMRNVTDPAVANGIVTGLGYFAPTQPNSANPLHFDTPMTWFTLDNQVYQDHTDPVHLSGALDTTPYTMVSAANLGEFVYLATEGGQLKRILRDFPSVVSIPTAPTQGRFVVLYGDRLLIGNDSIIGQTRVYYSDPIPADGSVPTFDVDLNYFDIEVGGSAAHGEAIVGMWVVRNQAWFALTDGTWWVYQGVPGVNDSLRLAYTGQSTPGDGAVVGTNAVWFVGRGENFPSYFNGSTVVTFADQDTGGLYGEPAAQPTYPWNGATVIPLSRRGDILFLGGAGTDTAGSLLLRSDKWAPSSILPSIGVAIPGFEGKVLLCTGGDDLVQPQFFEWQATTFERPADGFTTVAADDPVFSLPATLPPTSIVFPEIVFEGGDELTVRNVFVDVLLYFELGNDDGPTLRVTANATRMSEGSTDTSTTLLFTAPNPDSRIARRFRLDCGQQGSGAGALITLSEIRSMSIQQVLVEVEVADRRP